MKLGICDYGIGGLGLYKLLRDKCTADIVYISDSGYIPYGKVPEAELKKRVSLILKYFNKLGVYKIAVACNAASTIIPKDNNITGIIEHGMKMVFKIKPQKIAIVGGVRTIESGIYKTTFEKRGISTLQLIAQKLSIRIEAGDIDSAKLDKDIENIFDPIKNYKFILLACSHYPAIAARIKRFVRNARLLNPDEEMAEWILNQWHDLRGNSTVKWITSGDAAQMKFAAKKSFGVGIDKVERLLLS